MIKLMIFDHNFGETTPFWDAYILIIILVPILMLILILPSILIIQRGVEFTTMEDNF